MFTFRTFIILLFYCDNQTTCLRIFSISLAIARSIFDLILGTLSLSLSVVDFGVYLYAQMLVFLWLLLMIPWIEVLHFRLVKGVFSHVRFVYLNQNHFVHANLDFVCCSGDNKRSASLLTANKCLRKSERWIECYCRKNEVKCPETQLFKLEAHHQQHNNTSSGNIRSKLWMMWIWSVIKSHWNNPN